MFLSPDESSPRSSHRPEPEPDEIRAALRAHHGRVAGAAHALGLSSRYALYRLMKKHGIAQASPAARLDA